MAVPALRNPPITTTTMNEDLFSAMGSPRPPEIYIRTTPQPPGIPDIHELKGWEDLDRWGMMQHAYWHDIRRRTEWADGMSEIDKLRLLAGEMLRLNVDLMDRLLQTARLLPFPPVFVPSNTIMPELPSPMPRP